MCCRNRVTCYPEAVIWNALVDDWGLDMWLTFMAEAYQAEGSEYREDIGPFPSLAHIREWAQRRQACRRKGLPLHADPDLEEHRGKGSKARVVDEAVEGETVHLGLGSQVRAHSAVANDVLLAVGFHLYTHSKHNLSQEWPEKHLMRGVPCIDAVNAGDVCATRVPGTAPRADVRAIPL
jgi:hypothetical protein